MDSSFQGMSMGRSWVLDAVLHTALEEACTPGGFVDPRLEGLFADAHGHKQLQRQQEQPGQQLEQHHQDEEATRVRTRPLPPPSRGFVPQRTKRARPLPLPSRKFVPQRSKRPRTETKKFRLSSQARHELAPLEFREKIIIENKLKNHASEVHVLPLPEATFKPKPYPRRTKVAPFQHAEVTLHSAARAEARARWEVGDQARLEAKERCRREKAEALAELDRMIAVLRRLPPDEDGMNFKVAIASSGGASPLASNACPLCRGCDRQSAWVSPSLTWASVILLTVYGYFVGFIAVAAVLLGG